MAKKRKTGSTTSPDHRWYVWTGPDGKPLYCGDGCGRVANTIDFDTAEPLSFECVFEKVGIYLKATKKGRKPQERVA